VPVAAPVEDAPARPGAALRRPLRPVALARALTALPRPQASPLPPRRVTPASAVPRLESMHDTLFHGEVDQVTDLGAVVRLHKEVRVLQGDAPLALVRKHLPGGPTRPPVLLVHGFAQNRYTWHASMRSMSAWLAAQGFDTWNLELRGHGRSRPGAQPAHAPPTWKDDVFDAYVADLLRAAAALPAPAFWMGHSLGGAVCYAAAAQAQGPLAPRGIVGLAAMYGFAGSNRALGALTRATHALRESPLLQPVQVRTRLVGKMLGRLYAVSDVAGYTFPISGWWPGSVEPELLAERLERGFDWTSMAMWKEMSRWSVDGLPPFDRAWNQARTPVLVALGDKDHLMPPEDGRTAFDRAGGADRTLKVFDDWHDGVHWGHLDLVLGRHASRHVWPYVADWMAAR
jgi:polyhydroxyalkanoate synthase subunit PhaC